VILKKGAAGAALATVISQGVSFISCSVFLLKNKEKFELNVKLSDFFHMEKDMLSDLIGLGTPMAIKFASVQFSKLFVNSWVNSYGVEVSGFAGIANKIGSISNLISNALNSAGSSMVGQNLAAGEFGRVKKIIRKLFSITLTVAVLLSVIIILFPMQVYGIFAEDMSVLEIGYKYIPVAVLIFFGSACRAGMNALINGSGNLKVNFATAILDGIVLRIGLSLLFGIAFNMGYVGFWLGDALAGFTPFVIGIFFYFSGSWKKIAKSQ
jgi:Na+-driven multidrug efflux pump